MAYAINLQDTERYTSTLMSRLINVDDLFLLCQHLVSPSLSTVLSFLTTTCFFICTKLRITESAAENERLVFTRDPAYDWIPGRTMDDNIEANDGVHSTDISKKNHITSKVDSGEKWDTTTALDPKYKISSTTKVNLSEYAGNVLPLQNRDNKTGEPMSKSDLADLEHLHEAAMLHNSKEGDVLKASYSRVGDIVIATNLFTCIDGLNSEKQQSFCADRLTWSRAPTEVSNESNKDGDEEHKKEEDDTTGGGDDSGNAGGDSSSISKNAHWFTKLNHERKPTTHGGCDVSKSNYQGWMLRSVPIIIETS